MDQIALPFRIALVAIMAAGALWLTVLKPKDQTAASAPTAPGVTGLVTATDKARGAAATANAAAGTEAATGVDAAPAGSTQSSSPATTPAPAVKARAKAKAAGKSAPTGVAAGDPSAPLVRALDRGKVVVLLFADRRSADDEAARVAVKALGTDHGAVVKVVRTTSEVGRFDAITAGSDVTASPTLLVVAPDRTARTIVGLTNRAEVRQLVADQLHAARKAKR